MERASVQKVASYFASSSIKASLESRAVRADMSIFKEPYIAALLAYLAS